MSSDGIYRADGVSPPDRPMGVLPRASRFGEFCGAAADHIPLIPRADWSGFAGQSPVKNFVKEIKDQDGVGSCATESSTQAVQVIEAIAGRPFIELNPWFIYHTTSGGSDRGSSIDANLRFIREHGIAPASVWGRDQGWRKRPSDEAVEAALEHRIEEFYDIASVDEMVSALIQGWPVVWGSKGHSVLKVEHLNEREGLDCNSWGEKWGNGGFGVWTPYSSINWNYGAWALRTMK